MEQGWYKYPSTRYGKEKYHFFRNGEYGQGFLSLCGLREFIESLAKLKISSATHCRECLRKLEYERKLTGIHEGANVTIRPYMGLPRTK